MKIIHFAPKPDRSLPNQSELDTSLTDPMSALKLPEIIRDFKQDDFQATVPDDVADMQLAATTLARAARDAFQAACSAGDQHYAGIQMYVVRDALEKIWSVASVRSRAFRDLLAMLEAALKHREIEEFDQTQRAVLHSSFISLLRPFVDDEDVERIIISFAEQDIDITGPVCGDSVTRKFVIQVTEVE